ncbi:hypothetical protein ACWD4G_02725 [Streptomyces sp. NPDC002643]
MSNASGPGMTAWVGLAVHAVGPTGDRPYDAWLADVERTAVDLWLMSAPGGSAAHHAEALSSCTPVTGVLAQADVDGGRTRARLLLRAPGADGGEVREYSYHTEELTRRRARDVLERAQSLIGRGVRMLVSTDDSGTQHVLHIGDSGEREPGPDLLRGEQRTAAPAQPVTAVREPLTAAQEPVTATREPVAAVREPLAATPEPVAAVRQAPSPAPQPVAPAPAPSPAPVPAPSSNASATGVTWAEGSVSVWRNINRAWPKDYRTSCLLAVRERVAVDDDGLVLNLDELIEMAQQSPEPDTPRGKDIAARFPA